MKGLQEGWLVFGIHDNTREVVSPHYRKERAKLDSLKHDIAQQISNNFTFIEIHELFLDGKRMIMFQIPAAPRGVTVSWKGHFYGRNGESLSCLNITEIEAIRSPVSNDDWSAQVCLDATLADLDSDAILKARYEYKTKNQKLSSEIDKWDDITFLNKAKITI